MVFMNCKEYAGQKEEKERYEKKRNMRFIKKTCHLTVTTEEDAFLFSIFFGSSALINLNKFL